MALPKVTKRLVREFSCDPDSLRYPVWRNLFELSQMLELKPLTLAVNRQLVKMLETQYLDLMNAEAAPNDDDEAELSCGEEEVTKGPDHVEQEAADAAV
ncbi:hypothetical protein GGF31_006919 [Allomyces arbusculus]|nr:hypothetical protein GGF31_006919 [Allomyces arbusculus]